MWCIWVRYCLTFSWGEISWKTPSRWPPLCLCNGHEPGFEDIGDLTKILEGKFAWVDSGDDNDEDDDEDTNAGTFSTFPQPNPRCVLKIAMSITTRSLLPWIPVTAMSLASGRMISPLLRVLTPRA